MRKWDLNGKLVKLSNLSPVDSSSIRFYIQSTITVQYKQHLVLGSFFNINSIKLGDGKGCTQA